MKQKDNSPTDKYTEDYTLCRPQLKDSNGEPCSFNERLGNFTYGFDESVLKSFDLYGVSFCFFILWNSKKDDGNFNQKIWMKREITVDRSELLVNINSANFNKKFYAMDQPDTVNRNNRFFNEHGIKANYIILKDFDIADPPSDNSRVAIEIETAADGRLNKNALLLQQLRDILVKNSNGNFKMGKPLNYSETVMERYLSMTAETTGAVFPGDCDLLLYNSDMKCQYILEFKKCTAHGKYPIMEQSFLNYYSMDKSKYLRLNIMRKYFENAENKKIPLINIMYPTTSECIIKFEEITPDMTVCNTNIIPIADGPEENQYNMINCIVNNF